MTTLPANYFSEKSTTEKYGPLQTKFGKMAYGQFDPKGFGNFDPSTGIIGGNYGPYPDSSMQMTGGAAATGGNIVTPAGQVFKLMNTRPAPVYVSATGMAPTPVPATKSNSKKKSSRSKSKSSRSKSLTRRTTSSSGRYTKKSSRNRRM